MPDGELDHLFFDNEKLWKHKMYFAWRLSSVYYNENFDYYIKNLWKFYD